MRLRMTDFTGERERERERGRNREREREERGEENFDSEARQQRRETRKEVISNRAIHRDRDPILSLFFSFLLSLTISLSFISLDCGRVVSDVF